MATIRLITTKANPSHAGQVKGSARKKLAKSAALAALEALAAKTGTSVLEVRQAQQKEADKLRSASTTHLLQNLPAEWRSYGRYSHW